MVRLGSAKVKPWPSKVASPRLLPVGGIIPPGNGLLSPLAGVRPLQRERIVVDLRNGAVGVGEGEALAQQGGQPQAAARWRNNTARERIAEPVGRRQAAAARANSCRPSEWCGWGRRR